MHWRWPWTARSSDTEVVLQYPVWPLAAFTAEQQVLDRLRLEMNKQLGLRFPPATTQHRLTPKDVRRLYYEAMGEVLKQLHREIYGGSG